MSARSQSRVAAEDGEEEVGVEEVKGVLVIYPDR